MSYNANTAQMIGSQHEGIGPLVMTDKDWYKKLLKTALCSDTVMKVYSCDVLTRQGTTLNLQATEKCKYVAGQSIIVTNTNVPGLDGTYVVSSSEIPDKFSITIPEDAVTPVGPINTSLKTGEWTYVDVDSHITDFFPRDYVEGQDYFVRLDTTPFASLTSAQVGRACEFMIMLKEGEDLIHVNSTTRMALPTRPVPSKAFSNYNASLVKPRHKTWSLFFDHQSVYYFSGLKFGTYYNSNSTNYATSPAIYELQDIPDEFVRGNNTNSVENAACQHNTFNMSSLLNVYQVNVNRDSLVNFCFVAANNSEWHTDLPLLERRIFAAPPISISQVTQTQIDYIESQNAPSNVIFLRSCVLPVVSSNTSYDNLLRYAKQPNTNNLNTQINLSYGGAARSGMYPYHSSQLIGKELYLLRSSGYPFGTLPGRISITSNISMPLIPEVQRVDGGDTKFSLMGMPIEKYTDNSVLIGVCRGVTGGLAYDNPSTANTTTGIGAWDAMVIGGTWDVSN